MPDLVRATLLDEFEVRGYRIKSLPRAPLWNEDAPEGVELTPLQCAEAEQARALQELDKRMRRGAYAAFLSAGMTLVVVIFALQSNSGSALFDLAADLWNLIDVALVLACGVGLLYKSRVAGISLVVYYIIAKIYMLSELGFSPGLLFSFAFLYLYVRAASATFGYRKIMRKMDPTYGRTTWVGYTLCAFGGLLGLVAIGGLLAAIYAPTLSVVTGEELEARHRSVLSEEGILATGEEIVLFYSEGFFSVREGGAILTDQRVVSYEATEEEVWIESVAYADILTVEIFEKGSFAMDSLILLTPSDSDSFFLLVSTEEDGDERMLREILQRMEAVE